MPVAALVGSAKSTGASSLFMLICVTVLLRHTSELVGVMSRPMPFAFVRSEISSSDSGMDGLIAGSVSISDGFACWVAANGVLLFGEV